MCGGRKDQGQGPGPRASHTPKAGLRSNSWAVQWRLREALRARNSQATFCAPRCSGRVHWQATYLRGQPLATRSHFVNTKVLLLSRAWRFHLGLPSPSILNREAVSREEGGWGQGRRHPGRPPGLMQENLRVGKIPASHPQPRRILETLRSPPC